MLWDFSAVSPCSVEIGSGASGLVGGGTCTFLRFPESSTASVAGSIGLNATLAQFLGWSYFLYFFPISDFLAPCEVLSR